MYKDSPFSATAEYKILIVKTSSLGDIVHAFSVLSEIKHRFPAASIDWAVEERFSSLVAAHPLIRKTIPIHLKNSWAKILSSFRRLRKTRYDFVFDLQGNCKSGIVTFLSRGNAKIGFGLRSVREWPNILSTHFRFNISKDLNIRLQHLNLVQRFFQGSPSDKVEGVRFHISEGEKQRIAAILKQPELQNPMKIMVCPGSKWINKQLSSDTWGSFLSMLHAKFRPSFLLIWGDEAEKAFCERLRAPFPRSSALIEKLPIPTWQNLMNEVSLMIAVDSSALHLCGTTSTPTFSIFGPTSPSIFKPIGENHFCYQGPCPYGRTFTKQCPALRTCPTGSCIRDLKAIALFESFIEWWGKRNAEFVGASPLHPKKVHAT